LDFSGRGKARFYNGFKRLGATELQQFATVIRSFFLRWEYRF